MKTILILGIAFTLWQTFTKLLPVHSSEHYEKAAEKWSTGTLPALIGFLDMISLPGLVIVAILSFFNTSIINALLFCGAIALILVVIPGIRGARKLNKAMEKKE